MIIKGEQTMTLSLCQPGGRRGCCACCGLFNLRDISRGNLEMHLSRGRERALRALRDGREKSAAYLYNGDVRDPSSHVCQFQGFLGKGKPGCLVHPLSKEKDMRNWSLFGSRICDGFFCPAHEMLPMEHRGILLESVTDWYRYSIALIDPRSFLWMIGRLPVNGTERNGFPVESLNAALDEHAAFLNGTEGPVFYYSLSEYNPNSERFSLDSPSPLLDGHRFLIESILRNHRFS